MKHRVPRLTGVVLLVVLLSPLTPSYGSGIPTFDGAVLAPSMTGRSRTWPNN